MTITAGQVNGRDENKRAAQAASEPQPESAPRVSLEDLDGGTTLLQYQLAASETAIYPQVGTGGPEALAYLFLKLNGEAGEAGEKYAKVLRDKNGQGSLDDRDEVLKELGDVLWYLAMLADELDASLEQIALDNLKKLADRKARGVLGGSGDAR